MVLSYLQDLIIVAGHATFKANIKVIPERPELDESWILQNFQYGEPPFYIEHMRRGAVLAANNPEALLLFSGGLTRNDTTWKEAETYFEITRDNGFWIYDTILRENVQNRTGKEEYARDSYENLLFGICRFHQLVGHFPRLITVVSWAFKETRFQLHRDAIEFPNSRFYFDAFNEPIDMKGAWFGEKKALASFIKTPHGTDCELLDKRKNRTFGERKHGYEKCSGLEEFVNNIESLEPCQPQFPKGIKW